MAGFSQILVLAAVSFHLYCVHTIELRASPETFVPGVTANLTLRCTPGETISSLSNIAVFQLSKDGTLLATGRPDGVVLSENLRTSKYTVADQIDINNLANSFLVFTIQFPEAEDEGEYRCHMNYQDKDGFFQNDDSTLTVRQNATEDNNVESQLEQTLQLVENLMTRINTLESQVFTLSNDNKNNSYRIAVLDEQSSSHIGFFATLNNDLHILTDNVVVFDHVSFNKGEGFNDTTGVFVAPKAGFYVLNLVCEVHADVAIRMEMILKVDDTVVMKLFISGEESARGGQQSGSLVYDLAVGSKVKVVVGNIQTASDSQVDLLSDSLSFFSGYYLG